MIPARLFALALIVASGLGCSAPGGAPAPAPLPGPRPVVLLVPGRGYASSDSASVRTAWLRALREGARAATGEPLLADADVRMVWYADVLDPRSEAGCESPRDRERVSEAGVTRGLGAFGRGLLGALLDLMPDSAASPMQMLAGDIMYLSDDSSRCAAERRVDAALDAAAREGRDVVVVAHSMGGLVAYRALGSVSSAPAPVARTLVTIGAPLAVPLVRELVLGVPGTLVRPSRAGAWINVRDPDDPFAPSVLSSSGNGAVEVSLAPAGSIERAHDALRYLRDPRGAAPVLRAWCEGFGIAREAPVACGRLQAK